MPVSKNTERKNKNYDALVVLGAVMKWNASTRRWTFPPILSAEEYSGRLVVGEWRARAAALLQHRAPCILVTGGSNKHPETGQLCSRAVELARLIVEFGVPEQKVIPIGTNEASHTLGNVTNLGRYLEEHPSVHRVGVLSPRFQIMRAMVMHVCDPKLRRSGIQLEWIEVEATIVAHQPAFKKEIDAVYTSEAVDICWRKEQEGLWKFMQGQYEI